MGGVASVPGRGRKPKPTAKKELAGNPGKRSLNKNEPEFTEMKNIDVPDWIASLYAHATGMWETVAPELCKERVLSITDIHNLEIFCMAYQRWRDAQNDVHTYGVTIVTDTGSHIKNPALTAINESSRQMATFGSMLGLDPSSRSRLIGGRNDGGKNPFAELLGG